MNASKLFQKELKKISLKFDSYDKEDKICPTSNCNEKIVKLNISNRSTYVCNDCQK